MKRIQYITLRVFLVCMVACASLVLFLAWSTPPDEFTVVNRLTISSFVVGLASFLMWAVTVILEIRDKIEGR